MGILAIIQYKVLPCILVYKWFETSLFTSLLTFIEHYSKLTMYPLYLLGKGGCCTPQRCNRASGKFKTIIQNRGTNNCRVFQRWKQCVHQCTGRGSRGLCKVSLHHLTMVGVTACRTAQSPSQRDGKSLRTLGRGRLSLRIQSAGTAKLIAAVNFSECRY